MGKLLDVLIGGVLGGAIGVVILLALADKELFGTRGEREVYHFQCQGRPVVLMQEDNRLAFDRYYFLVEGKYRKAGTITTDEGLKVEIPYNDPRLYSVSQQTKQ